MTDHIQMLCDIGEMNRLFAESISIETFLERIVIMVSDHMNAQVCSIYLYEQDNDILVLKATIGLDVSAVNTLSLKPNEGLVGKAFSLKESVNEKSAENNPDYKFIPGIDEEFYQAFLAVPVVFGASVIGVLVLQRNAEKPFSNQDIIALEATSSQMASMIGNARTILMANKTGFTSREKDYWAETRFIKGKTASRGFAVGPSMTMEEKISLVRIAHGSGKSYSLEDFQHALQFTEEQLENLQEKVEEKLDDAASLIFSSHLLMLKDVSFIKKMTDRINQGINASSAVIEVFDSYRLIFQSSPNRLIREKVQDLEDLVRRILENLLDLDHEESRINNHIVITRELFPSDLLRLSAEGVLGIVLVSGGVTSHIAILARSLDIPMIIIPDKDLLYLVENTSVLMDADLGNLYVNPEPEVLKTFEERNRNRETLMKNRDVVATPAVTTDGYNIQVMVNVNLLTDLNRVDSQMIDGVGLYRTEFPFLIRNSFPSEEEQFVIYKKLFTQLPDRMITFRTLDIGGDKILSYYEGLKEQNPFLGMRSIRFSLSNEDIFYTQIRAILRAGHGYQLRIMFPMISSLEEYNRAVEIVIAVKQDLQNAGIDYHPDPELGIMVELPSAVMIINEIAAAADFISVGTNDLVQYTLGVDRTNDLVAHLYIPHHPAVIRSLHIIGTTARAYGKKASICGDMGSSPLYIPFLIGSGFNILSVDSGSLPLVKQAIRKGDYEKMRKMSEHLTSLGTVEEIEHELKNFQE